MNHGFKLKPEDYYRLDALFVLLIILGFTSISFRLNQASEWGKQGFAKLRNKMTESVEMTGLLC